MRVEQRYIVLLSNCYGDDCRQIWLGYDDGGRIGNCDYQMAFRYTSQFQATLALRKLRGAGSKWPAARIFGTTIEVDD